MSQNQNNPGAARAEILSQALPFMQRYAGKIVVIKYGGAAMEDGLAAKSFAQDVVLLHQSGVLPVVVHGGGKAINKMFDQLNIKSEFKNGLRITTKAMAKVVEMVLAGSVNKKIVDDMGAAGGQAVGLSGRDGNLMRVKKYDLEDLGFVGQPDKINKEIIMTLLAAGIIPVIAPIGSDAQGQVYNVNADVAAGAIAAELGAVRLLMMTDVAGLMDKDETLVPHLSAENAKALVESGVATDGMRPKIEMCVQAVRSGVKAAVILDGRQTHALLLELFTPHGVGTMIE